MTTDSLFVRAPVADAHPDDCDCATTCHAYRLASASVAESSNAIARQCLAGIALGVAVSWVADRLADGPGLLAAFGL